MFDHLTHRSLFGDLDSLYFAPPHREQPQRATWQPALEGHVKDNTLVVRVDLPGVDPKDVEVSLDGGLLRIVGERKHEEETKQYSERRYGRFERTVTVPEGVDPEKITAHSTHGVLEVTVPLATVQKARRVPVQTDAPPQESKKAA